MTNRVRLSSSTQKAAELGVFRSCRRRWARGSVLWLPVRLRPEGLHQRRGPGFRDAEEPLHVPAGEERPVGPHPPGDQAARRRRERLCAGELGQDLNPPPDERAGPHGRLDIRLDGGAAAGGAGSGPDGGLRPEARDGRGRRGSDARTGGTSSSTSAARPPNPPVAACAAVGGAGAEQEEKRRDRGPRKSWCVGLRSGSRRDASGRVESTDSGQESTRKESESRRATVEFQPVLRSSAAVPGYPGRDLIGPPVGAPAVAGGSLPEIHAS